MEAPNSPQHDGGDTAAASSGSPSKGDRHRAGKSPTRAGSAHTSSSSQAFLSSSCSMPSLRNAASAPADPQAHQRGLSKRASKSPIAEEPGLHPRHGSRKMDVHGAARPSASRMALGATLRLNGCGVASMPCMPRGSPPGSVVGGEESGDEALPGGMPSLSSSSGIRHHTSLPAEQRRRGAKPLFSAEEQLCLRRGVPVLASRAAHDHGGKPDFASTCTSLAESIAAERGAGAGASASLKPSLGRCRSFFNQLDEPMSAQPSLGAGCRRAQTEGNLAFTSTMPAQFFSHHARNALKEETISEGDCGLGGTLRRTVAPNLAHTAKLPGEDDTEKVLERVFPVCSPSNRRTPSRRSPSRQERMLRSQGDWEGGWEDPPARRRGGSKDSPGSPCGSAFASSHTTLPSVTQSVFSSTGTLSTMASTASSSAATASTGVPRQNRKPFAPASKLLLLRKQMMDRYQTVSYAIEAFHSSDFTHMSLRKFNRFMGKYFNAINRETSEQLFEYLDRDKDGSISLHELHMAIEAAAPATTLEDLRRRWIALGFLSMRRAMEAMQPLAADFAVGQRLSLQEFGEALSRSGISTAEEHQLIFCAVHDPADTTNTVTMELLASALVAISPFRLLEDLRDRVLRRFEHLDESWDAAAEAAQRLAPCQQPSAAHSIGLDEFCAWAVEVLKLTPHEARKSFRLMADGQGDLSRRAFVGALRLSDPALMLEDVRRKVRQRFHSIRAIFADDSRPAFAQDHAIQDRRRSMSPALEASRRRNTSPLAPKDRAVSIGGDWDSGEESTAVPDDQWEVLGTVRDFQRALSSVALTEGEVRRLFDLVDADGEGQLTPAEFVAGLRLFAPSCVLEDLRIQIMRVHGGVSTAFARRGADHRGNEVLTEARVRHLLEELHVATGVHFRKLMDCVESRPNGGLSVAELASAVRAAGPGDQIPLRAQQRDARARREVRSQLARFRRSAEEFKTSLRLLNATAEDDDEDADADSGAKTAMPAETGPSSGMHPKTKRTFERLTELVKTTNRSDLADKVEGYFASASDSMASGEGVLSTQSRYEAFCAAERHRPYCDGERPELLMEALPGEKRPARGVQ